MSKVYFVQAGDVGPVKIGTTSRPIPQRIAALQTGCPQRLRLLASVTGAPSHERRLHAKLSPYRIGGEWFRASREVLDLVARVASDDFQWERELALPPIQDHGGFASSRMRALFHVADLFCRATGLSKSYVSTIVFNDGKKLDLIASGADLRTGTFDRAMLWFSTNWPEGVDWPLGISRPSASASVQRAS